MGNLAAGLAGNTDLSACYVHAGVDMLAALTPDGKVIAHFEAMTFIKGYRRRICGLPVKGS